MFFFSFILQIVILPEFNCLWIISQFYRHFSFFFTVGEIVRQNARMIETIINRWLVLMEFACMAVCSPYMSCGCNFSIECKEKLIFFYRRYIVLAGLIWELPLFQISFSFWNFRLNRDETIFFPYRQSYWIARIIHENITIWLSCFFVCVCVVYFSFVVDVNIVVFVVNFVFVLILIFVSVRTICKCNVQFNSNYYDLH